MHFSGSFEGKIVGGLVGELASGGQVSEHLLETLSEGYQVSRDFLEKHSFSQSAGIVAPRA